MKCILLVFTIFNGMTVSAQKIKDKWSKADSIAWNHSLIPLIQFTIDTTDHKGQTEIIFNFPDSTIDIRGDTTKVLWLMYKYMSELEEKYGDCMLQKTLLQGGLPTILSTHDTIKSIKYYGPWTDARNAQRDTMIITKPKHHE